MIAATTAVETPFIGPPCPRNSALMTVPGNIR
jgi:hypothetical protein